MNARDFEWIVRLDEYTTIQFSTIYDVFEGTLDVPARDAVVRDMPTSHLLEFLKAHPALAPVVGRSVVGAVSGRQQHRWDAARLVLALDYARRRHRSVGPEVREP